MIQDRPFGVHNEVKCALFELISSRFGHSKVAKCLENGLSWGVESFLENHVFYPLLTHFWAQNNPMSRHFVILEGPKWLAMGSKLAQFTFLGTPNGLGSFLENHIFDAF